MPKIDNLSHFHIAVRPNCDLLILSMLQWVSCGKKIFGPPPRETFIQL